MAKKIFAILLFIFPLGAFALDSLYCPQHAKYIKLGMTSAEITDACGEPLHVLSEGRVSKEVPTTQLIYTTINSGFDAWGGTTNLYQQWSLPEGAPSVNLQFDVVDNKITNIRFNGDDAQLNTVCSGGNLKVGDPSSLIYQYCGNPQVVNHDIAHEPVPADQHPQIWVYQIDDFQKPFSLTLINGKLVSITQ